MSNRIADFLAISELILGQPAEDIARVSRLELAESALHPPAASFGGVEFYPGLAIKAAVLCTRLVKNHPLPDGNKRAGFVCMIEFCLRNGLTWTPPRGDEDGELSAQIVFELAAGRGGEDTIATLGRLDQGPNCTLSKHRPPDGDCYPCQSAGSHEYSGDRHHGVRDLMSHVS